MAARPRLRSPILLLAALATIVALAVVLSRERGERAPERRSSSTTDSAGQHESSKKTSEEPSFRLGQRPSEAEPETLAVGTVFDVTGRPASEGVHVTASFASLCSRPFAETTTDASGNFRVELRVPRQWHAGWPKKPGQPGVDMNAVRRTTVTFAVSGSYRETTARPATFSFRSLGPHRYVPLRLVAGGTLKVQVVDTDGAAVPFAHCWIKSCPFQVRRWEKAAIAGGSFESVADAQGKLGLVLPPGHVSVWARGPTGPFGEGTHGIIRPGQTLDVGRAHTAGGTVQMRLRITDEDGLVVEGAGLRLDAENSVQRRVRSDAGNSAIHCYSDNRGVIDVVTGCADHPMYGVIASKKHGSLRIVMGRSHPGEFEYELVLAEKPRFALSIQTETGKDVTGVVVPHWSLVPLGKDTRSPSGSDATDSVVLGAPQIDYELSEAQKDDVAFVEGHFDDLEPVLNPDGGSLVFYTTTPGRYRLKVELPPGFRTEAEVLSNTTPNRPPYTIVIPDGRKVTLELRHQRRADGRSAAQRLGLSTPVHVWPATEAMPPPDWPATVAEAIDATVRSSGLVVEARDASTSVGLWVPRAYSHLLMGRFRPIEWFRPILASKRSGTCPLCGHPLDECGHDLPGSPHTGPPGSRRFPLGKQHSRHPLYRIRIPRGEYPVVGFALPLRSEPDNTRFVEAQVVVTDLPLRQSAIELVARCNPDRNLSVCALTDKNGIAHFALTSGEWHIQVAPHLAPPAGVEVVIRRGTEPVCVRVPFAVGN